MDDSSCSTGGRRRDSSALAALSLRDLHDMIFELQGSVFRQQDQILAQEKEIAALQKEALDLHDEIQLLKETRLPWDYWKLRFMTEEIAALPKWETRNLYDKLQQLMKGPRLPWEVQFRIVEAARHDNAALKKFSLVAKAWTRVSRKMLFRTISFRSCYTPEKVSTLTNDGCTVFPYIQTLYIISEESPHWVYRPHRANSESAAWMDGFLALMPKFYALTSIKIKNLEPKDLDALVRSTPVRMLQAIRVLDISVRGITLSAIAAFISDFSALTTLICRDGWHHETINEAAAPPPKSITTVIFIENGSLSQVVLQWFADRHCGVVESMSIHKSLLIPYRREFAGFINRFGPGLSNLEVSVDGNDFGYLAKFKQLKTMKMLIDFWYITVELVAKFVSQLPSRFQLDSLTLDIRNFHALTRESTMAHWSQLDRSMMTADSLSNLSRLTVVIHDYTADPTRQLITEFRQKFLPLCAKNRPLEIEYRDVMEKFQLIRREY
ncbi:hypothetical protein R3P38DRAFT_2862652 [Favolaschia claudopus]|uniref:F-box domain-containing protein n=1 Tax=Favolaschia claudopus TaxID=2862362 RepID=A0AAW0DHG4_9AGAR